MTSMTWPERAAMLDSAVTEVTIAHSRATGATVHDLATLRAVVVLAFQRADAYAAGQVPTADDERWLAAVETEWAEYKSGGLPAWRRVYRRGRS